MGKARYYEFIVSGQGAFPFDMLRYDAAYPAGAEGVAAISMVSGAHGVRVIGDINVRLATMVRPPCEVRWASFGWKVSDVRVVP